MVSLKIKKPSSKVKKYRRSVKFRRIQQGGSVIQFKAKKLPEKYAHRYLDWGVQLEWQTRNFTFDTQTKKLTWEKSGDNRGELNLASGENGAWNLMLDTTEQLFDNIVVIRYDNINKLALKFKDNTEATNISEQIIKYLPSYQEFTIKRQDQARRNAEARKEAREAATREAEMNERAERIQQVGKLEGLKEFTTLSTLTGIGGASKKYKSNKKRRKSRNGRSPHKSRRKHRKSRR